MLRFLRAARLGVLLFLVSGFWLSVQAQAPKVYSSSDILLGLKKLNVVGSVMYIAAHPDDENTRLLAYLANERQLETSYLSLTRGDGGQNLIGPELREQLGVIRTQELLAARRIDGAHQFFTRANDFGFSKTAQEALSVWDHEQVLADVVWVIRQRRPDVLITRFPPDARAGHGHHQASAVLAAEAFDAAGDPKRFPEQLKYVQPWQPKRLYWNTGSFFVKPGEDMSGYLKLDTGGYNPLLGQSYGELAARSRSQHRSQGMGSSASRGETFDYFQFVKGTPAKTDLFEGIDHTWNRVPGGAAIGKLVSEVIRTYDAANPSASVPALLSLFRQMVALRLENQRKVQGVIAKDYNSYFWVSEKISEVEQLIKSSSGIYVEAIASQSSIVPGDSIDVTVEVVNRAKWPVTTEGWSIIGGKRRGGDSIVHVLKSGAARKEIIKLVVPSSEQLAPANQLKGAELDDSLKEMLERDFSSQPYWLFQPSSVGMYEVKSQLQRGKPDNDALFKADGINLLGTNGNWLFVEKDKVLKSIGFSVPVQYKHTDPVLGELYQPLTVVPPVLVNIPAARAYVFADQQPKQVPVTLRAGQAGVAGSLALQVPSGWQAEPATVAFTLKNKDDEQTVNFTLRPLPGAAEGKAELRAVATVGTAQYSRGIQTIQYPHIPTQTLFPEATAPLVKLSVARGHTKSIGYLMGAGDEVPEALRQLGYTVSLLDPATDLTAERLAKYDAVVLGVRAYNVLDRLKTQQPELLRYVENGGTLLVQYVVNRGTVLPQIGPYPLTLSADRVTVENTPVTFLPSVGGATITRPAAQPTTPTLAQSLLSTPNKLTPADFSIGWVQEQGLYYPSAWDSHYQTVIASHDPDETDKQSAILVAPYGKGRYIYTGLSLFRELPAGVPGAFRVLANLVESGGK